MDEKKFVINIDYDAVKEQYEEEQRLYSPKKTTTFDEKNYLQARLNPGENQKSLTIRLLPFSTNGGDVFQKVYAHTYKVNKEVAPSGWKTFICPNHNTKDGESFNVEGCPFCETAAKAKELKNAALDEATKKKYGEVEFMSRVKTMWIVRCIDRDHEEDGVKFWLFNSSKKKDGVWDQINNLAKIRSAAAERKGNKYNIFDVNNGLDLIVTLTRDENNKTRIQVVDDGTPSPLSDDVDLGNSWLMDEKKWYEVYTVKPYNYMSIIVSNGVPVYNKELGKYVDKYANNEARPQSEDLTSAEDGDEPIDFSKIVSSGDIITDTTESATVQSEAPVSGNNDDEDLPF